MWRTCCEQWISPWRARKPKQLWTFLLHKTNNWPGKEMLFECWGLYRDFWATYIPFWNLHTLSPNHYSYVLLLCRWSPCHCNEFMLPCRDNEFFICLIGLPGPWGFFNPYCSEWSVTLYFLIYLYGASPPIHISLLYNSILGVFCHTDVTSQGLTVMLRLPLT